MLATALGLWAVPAAAQPDTAVGAGFEVERYDLSLRPMPAEGSLRGREAITIRSERDGLRTLVFSPNALVIDRARANGRRLRVTSDAEGIALRLRSPLRRGDRITVRLRYHGVPRRGVTASPTAMYTSYFACDWMICLQDAPGDKAWFALDLRVPRGVTSLASGLPVGERRLLHGMEIHRWRSSRPVSAYLLGFAVGLFNRVGEQGDGAVFDYYGQEVAEPELRRLFAETPRIATFFAQRAGVPLPDGRYAQLLTAGREAQEAATYSLIGREELAREAADPPSQWVIAHELAHMWWGNLVTARTWQHFWLNEGITTFMTAAWKEHRFGPAAYRAEMDGARARLERARTAGWDRPLAFAGAYPNLGTRRAIQYSKGALFMDHLRTLLGEQAFWAGLRTFTMRHAGGSVTSADFQRAMEEAAGRDLGPAFREWVFGAGVDGSEPREVGAASGGNAP